MRTNAVAYALVFAVITCLQLIFSAAFSQLQDADINSLPTSTADNRSISSADTCLHSVDRIGSSSMSSSDTRSKCDCPYRRPWNSDMTWISLIEANQYRPCADAWITSHVDQGGFGSDLHVWSADLAYAMEKGSPMVTQASLSKPGALNYFFGNSSSCRLNNDDGGIGCYFDDRTRCNKYNINLDPDGTMHRAATVQHRLPPGFNGSVSDWRRTAVTFLFMHPRPWLLEHACSERESIHFEAPDIAVHFRRGDKWKEVRLVETKHYIEKVKQIVEKYLYPPNVKVFLMTEDYRALEEFRAAADPRWRLQVYEPAMFPRTVDLDQASPRSVAASGYDVATNSLVAMFMCLEAMHYIGASGSNWSRLMNELRQSRNMYSPTCQGCTHFHDLQFISNGVTEGHPQQSSEW